MDILITGAGGFLGRRVASRFRARSHKVLGLDVPGSPGHIELAIDLARVSAAEFERLVPAIDAVVHLASIVDFAPEFSARLNEVNVLGTQKVARLAGTRKALMIFTSSVSVHAVAEASIGRETPVSPSQPYGVSKWLGERIVEESGAKSLILRPAGMIGYHGPSHLRFNRTIHAAATEGTIPVVMGRGAGRRNYAYVGDVADAIVEAAERGTQGLEYYGGRDPLSVAEMARQICDVFLPGRTPRFEEGPEATDQIVEVSRNLKTPRTFNEALSEMKEEYAANRAAQ